MSDNFIASQILAALAFVCGVASFQFRARHLVLACLALACVFNGLHFFTLGRPGPGTLVLITAVRFLVATKTHDRRVMFVFMCIALLSFFYTYTSNLSYLALFASLLGTYASFTTSDKAMRILIMIGTTTWLLHNTLAGTPVAAIMEAVMLGSNLLGFRRYHARENAKA